MTQSMFNALSCHDRRPRRLALLAGGIAAAALLAGCSSQAPRPEKMAQQANEALSHGQTPRAVTLAEGAVLADGRNPALRLLLANAYFRGGRFESARDSYAEAIELGDDSSRAALGLILCDLALGRASAALDTINTYGDVLQPADLGLALALAGQHERAIAVLSTAIRDGQNTPKVRQNLALTYAMAGMWNEARVMASQDLPADQVGARIQGWAAMARPEDGRRRIASLSGVPLVNDTGRPEMLALAHFPGDKPAAAAAPTRTAAAAPAAAPAAELPPVQTPLESGALARIDLPPAAAPTPTPPPAPVRAPVMATVSIPVVEPIPAAHRAPAAPLRVAQAQPYHAPAAAPHRAMGTHLVQLGSFNSEESAQRAWRHFVARDPHLAGHPNLITKVSVNGRDFWRVQAAGFTGQAAAAGQCSQVRAHGGVCMVMAVNAAARVNGVQMAAAKPALQPAAAHAVPTRPGKPNATRR